MSIRRTLWALPAVSTVIFAIGLSISAWLTTQALSAIETTGSVDYPVLEHTSALINDVQSVTTHLKGAIMAGERERIAQADAQADTFRSRIVQIGKVAGRQALANRLGQEFDAYYLPARAGTEWMMGIASTDEKASVQKAKVALEQLQTDLQQTNAQARRQFAAGIEQSERNVQRVLDSTIVSALVVVLCLVGVSYLVVRSVWARLGGEPEYAHAIAQAVAGGDLSMEIRMHPKDEKSLLAAIRRMKHMLEGMIGEIKQSGETITTASREIAAGNADLAARTESQASSLEQISSAMDEMTSTVRKNVDHAVNANRMSVTASEVAQRGGEAVEQAVATMDDIHRSAQKIADITGVIDGIAFQTNILALNAAVEAARAGEQGRGFAVVAGEVRNLAQRSASAAREIKALIQDSVGKVEAGRTTVHQAGTTMSEILASVQAVADIMHSIATASQEQSSGIEEIGKAIAQMDANTQQNAAMVEQASAAAMSLERQALVLNDALSVFQLTAGDGERQDRQLALQSHYAKWNTAALPNP